MRSNGSHDRCSGTARPRGSPLARASRVGLGLAGALASGGSLPAGLPLATVLAAGGPARAEEPWGACAHLAAPALDECSGMVQSRRLPGVYWVHDDSGDRARFFAVGARGEWLAEVWVDGARNVDWEDIAVDDSGHVYLGDFGNNLNARRDLVVCVADEPDPRGAASPLHVAVARRLPFHYPDQRAFPDSAHLDFDCEAMFWDASRLYLLTKHRSDIRTTLYRLDPWQTQEQVAVRIGSAAIGSPVTAADCSPDGGLLAVLSYRYIHLFERPAQGDDFLAGREHATLIEGRQCEGICFDGERLLFTNEQRDIFCVSLRYLKTHDRYLPAPPQVAVPHVEPQVDGRPGEWRALGGAGRLVFDRYVQVQDGAVAAWDARTTRRAAAVAADSARVRIGWCPLGALVHARWQVAGWRAAVLARRPLAYLVLGPAHAGRPCLEADQFLWSAVPEGDSLLVRAAEPEPGQPRCGAALAAPTPTAATRRHGTLVELEALLPAAGAAALAPGAEFLLNVVLLDPDAGRMSEFGWSASLDMQPLGNPLLWGRARLAAEAGATSYEGSVKER